MAKIKITQTASAIRTLPKQRKTLEALGLRKIRRSVVREDNASLRGMLTIVNHLVKTEELK